MQMCKSNLEGWNGMKFKEPHNSELKLFQCSVVIRKIDPESTQIWLNWVPSNRFQTPMKYFWPLTHWTKNLPQCFIGDPLCSGVMILLPLPPEFRPQIIPSLPPGQIAQPVSSFQSTLEQCNIYLTHPPLRAFAYCGSRSSDAATQPYNFVSYSLYIRESRFRSILIWSRFQRLIEESKNTSYPLGGTRFLPCWSIARRVVPAGKKMATRPTSKEMARKWRRWRVATGDKWLWIEPHGIAVLGAWVCLSLEFHAEGSSYPSGPSE